MLVDQPDLGIANARALAGLLLITRVRLPPHGARGERTRVHHDIGAGWRWPWAHAAIRTLAITIFTFNITFGLVRARQRGR